MSPPHPQPLPLPQSTAVEVWLVLYGCAKEGNMAAIKEFLDRTCGKAEDDELQARVDQLEALLEQHR